MGCPRPINSARPKVAARARATVAPERVSAALVTTTALAPQEQTYTVVLVKDVKLVPASTLFICVLFGGRSAPLLGTSGRSIQFLPARQIINPGRWGFAVTGFCFHAPRPWVCIRYFYTRFMVFQLSYCRSALSHSPTTFWVWISVVRTRASSNNFSSRGCLKCYLLALVKATGKNYVLASL